VHRCTLVYRRVRAHRLVHKCARCTLVYRGGECTQVCKVHTCVRFFGEDLPPPTSNLLTCGSAFSPNYTCMNCGDAACGSAFSPNYTCMNCGDAACGSAFSPNYTCMKSATVPHGTYGVFGSPCDVITLHYITLHYITLHYITLHHTTSH
jgi:hypothetical protein